MTGRLMGISTAVLLSLNLFFGSTNAPTLEGWRGIVPLHSTRADVEALLLGPGTSECKCTYYLDDVNLFFVYSSSNCKTSGSEAWNVPIDTVLSITVYPKPSPKFSELEIDKTRFNEKPDGHIADHVFYVNDEDGLIISVNTERDIVMAYYYVPTAKDQHLRCP
jgi:hypothetical protein